MPDTDPRIAELERRLTEEVARFERLLALATELNGTPNLDDLLVLIVSGAKELLDAEMASLLLLDEETDELVFRVSGDVAEVRMPATEGIAGWVVQHGQATVVEDPASDDRFSQRIGKETGTITRNLLAAPLLSQRGCVGVVEVMNKAGSRPFEDRDLTTARALASLAAVAVENAALYERLTEQLVAARLGSVGEAG